ncbi:DUF2510 domain-containing protein [Microbacterium thalassium]|uniref:Type II secretory pathway pseudopilin PulG n=1 Tax=Microbacterium thalassium TaxID=362649 RepID=A0A7X0FLK9_9MICO|nr:DUF2510 domain-containing protein [Microbacterium thalassium]MBB6389728.1 type II secretory pathway pseudopilin PulG [Microbacterium thalassium]GLK24779.1 hypothetical protein GCM10017607_20970 [Microbacterium thalassium]
MATEKRFRAEIPDGTHLDVSRDTTGAYRGTLRDEENRLVGHVELHEIDDADEYSALDEYVDDDGDSNDDETGLGSILAGLALVGLTLGAVAAVGAVQDRKARRREEEAQTSTVQPAEATDAPPGWYDAGAGRQRWWDGQKWTDHFQADPHHAPAPAGWYDDGFGRQRWWDGFEWTAHFQTSQALVAAPPVATSDNAPGIAPRDVEVAVGLPQITMSSAEWQERVRAMLLAKAISEQQWRLLSAARIEDAGNELLAWQQQLASLTPQQFSDQLNIALDSDPALAGASLQLAQAGWYDDGSGRGGRWWDGSQWTEHYMVPARATAGVTAPAGLYEDGSGRQRWWDGQTWG